VLRSPRIDLFSRPAAENDDPRQKATYPRLQALGDGW
jgi:hypothetical protein